MPLLHVPYRGVAPAVLAVTRGEVDLFCADITGALGLLQGDKVTALAITSREARASPAGCRAVRRSRPAELRADRLCRHHGDRRHAAAVIAKLNASINEVIHEPEFAKKFAALGYDMVGGTAEGFGKFLKDDIESLSAADAIRRHHAGIAPAAPSPRGRTARAPDRPPPRSDPRPAPASRAGSW